MGVRHTAYRQVQLRSGTSELVTNLDDHPKLRVGNWLTLKDNGDPDRRWEIVWVAPHTRSQLRTRWDAGGLV